MVIVPAYNEQDTLLLVVQQLLDHGLEVIVVDDGSENNLRAIVHHLPVYFLRHPVNLGQGAAIQTGIEFAISKNVEIIVTFDADGQHTAADITSLVQPIINREVEMTMGSRFLRGSIHNMSFTRKLLLQAGRYVNYLFTGLLLTDTHNGLRAMTIAAAAKIQLIENRMAHATEILLQVKKHKISFKEVPVNIVYTPYSKLKGQKAHNSVRIVFDLFLNKFFK